MKKVRLQELGIIITGNTPKTSESENYSSDDICFVKPSDISEEEINNINTSEFFISESARKKARILPPDSILVTCIGIIGKIAINNIECAFNQQINAIIPDSNNCLPLYLAYAIQSQKHIMQNMANAPVVPILNKTQFSDIEIPLHSIEIQKKIVDILDKVSFLITKRKEQLSKLDELVKARFVELFGDLRINEKEWEIKTFSELAEIITDGEHSTPRRVEKGIYLLSARNVLNHSLQLDDVDYIDEDEYLRISKRIIPQKGDVLISCSGSVGRCCSVPENLKFQMVRSVAIVRFKNIITPIFAEYMITSDYLQEQINGSKTMSSQANLFQGKIAKLKGFVPPIELQQQFAALVEQTDKSKLEVQKGLEKLELLKKSLMQKYFG